MIIIIKNSTPENKVQGYIEQWKEKGYGVHISKGEQMTILGLLGDTSTLDTEFVSANPIVESAQRVTDRKSVV